MIAVDYMNLLVRAWHVGKPTANHAVVSMFQTLAKASERLGDNEIVFAMDGGYDHRTKLLPSYKQRDPKPENLQQQIKLGEDVLTRIGFPVIRAIGFEADDVIASLAAKHADIVICSSDKDLLACPGRVYHPWGEGKFVTAIEKLGVERYQVLDYRALDGDKSDNVPGVVGIGPVTAKKLIAEYGNLEAIVAAAVQGNIKGATGKKMLEQKKQAFLCRDVIELRTNLPVGFTSTVRAGWPSALRDMDLSRIVGVVERIIAPKSAPIEPKGSTKPSATPAKVERPSSRRMEPGTTGRTQASPVESEGWIFRPIHEPIRDVLPKDPWAGPDKGLILCWERGRIAADQHLTTDRNPWKRDSLNSKAWIQGFSGQDLDLPAKTASATEPAGPVGQPVPDEPRERKQLALF